MFSRRTIKYFLIGCLAFMSLQFSSCNNGYRNAKSREHARSELVNFGIALLGLAREQHCSERVANLAAAAAEIKLPKGVSIVLLDEAKWVDNEFVLVVPTVNLDRRDAPFLAKSYTSQGCRKFIVLFTSFDHLSFESLDKLLEYLPTENQNNLSDDL